MGNSEAFAAFQTCFLLLAHESHLRPEDYRDELWHKITLALGTAIAAVEAQMVIYNQLADCLLSTDINLKWLSCSTSKAELSRDAPKACRECNQAGQFLSIHTTPHKGTFYVALDRLYNRSSTPSLLTTHSGTAPLPGRRSTTLALNSNHVGDTCYNCG
jgi:hypothetical protein